MLTLACLIKELLYGGFGPQLFSVLFYLSIHCLLQYTWHPISKCNMLFCLGNDVNFSFIFYFLANSGILFYNSGKIWKSDTGIFKAKEEQTNKKRQWLNYRDKISGFQLILQHVSDSKPMNYRHYGTSSSWKWNSIIIAREWVTVGVGNHRFPACNDLLEDVFQLTVSTTYGCISYWEPFYICFLLLWWRSWPKAT